MFRSPVTVFVTHRDPIAELLGPGQWRGLRRYITVNDERVPTITVTPGEVRRLRVIATGQRESVRLRI